MAYIFLDESGDLGFGKASSKWFLCAIAMTTDPRSLERVVKKAWKTLRRKHVHIGELHATHEKAATRKRLLKMLGALDDLKILCVILNKAKVYIDLQNQKHYLYTYTANILLDRLHTQEILAPGEPLDIYIDRKDTKKHLRENFLDYLTKSMKKRRDGALRISLHASYENKSLQAVDFISWAIFQKYERGNLKSYDLIKKKIVEERLLFP